MGGWGLREGDAITEDLVAVRRLGGGATYEAYLAFDEVTWGPVVTKLVRPDLVGDAASLRGLRREAAALAAVNHPVVVRALRWSDEGPRPHLVLENLDGPRLSSLVRKHGRLQPQQYLVLGIELASALHYLRRTGWVHLDVKPSNIIMGAPARLIDLSVARSVEDARPLPGDVPPAVREVLRAGLSRDPGLRPLPHEVSEALEPVLHALPAPRLAGWRS
jgi:serine/threonine protein kinase